MTSRRKNRPEEIVAKLRDVSAMPNAGKDPAAVLLALKSAGAVILEQSRESARKLSRSDPQEKTLSLGPPLILRDL